MPVIISADEIKKKLPDYSPKKAELFHRQSSKLADKEFEAALRRKKPVIFAVIPDDLKRAFIAFLNRDRKFSDKHFYRTHSGSRKTLLWIASEYPEIEINIVESSYTPDQKLQFLKIEFDSRQKFIEYLTGKQLTENDIINLMRG